MLETVRRPGADPMNAFPLGPLARRLRRLAEPPGAESDRQLLRRFAAARDEAAFAELVARHGPLVRGVCRRVAGDASADDAFQATFLVLARRAGTLRWGGAVGPWLYAAARRVALKARAAEARRRRRERAAAPPAAEPVADPGWRELLAVLDEELRRLPERYRAPLLACYLEGRTQDEAARQLGWSVGTLRRRLER